MTGVLLALLLLLAATGVRAPGAPPEEAPVAGTQPPAASAVRKWPPADEELRVYRESGAWGRDIAERARVATRALTSALSARGSARPALALDVDDTSLSTYPCLDRVDFAGSAARCARRTDLPAIAPIRALFRLAQRRGVEVRFITERPERLRRATVTNLRRAGYTGRWRLHMRPDRQPAHRHGGWKARTRRALTLDGRTILVNVGDQRSDLTGGWARHAIKLPNPMYLIPSA